MHHVTQSDTTDPQPVNKPTRHRYDYSEVADIARKAGAGSMGHALCAHYDISLSSARQLISRARAQGHHLPDGRRRNVPRPRYAPVPSVPSGLGPIGKLPVDADAARDAAAGPKEVIPPTSKQAFRRPDTPPVNHRPHDDDRFTIDDAREVVGQPRGGPMRANWTNDANCLGLDPDLFFPERGSPTAQTKAVCNQCSVRAECLTYAIDNHEKHGIWGGLSERERRQLRRQIAAKVKQLAG